MYVEIDHGVAIAILPRSYSLEQLKMQCTQYLKQIFSSY